MGSRRDEGTEVGFVGAPPVLREIVEPQLHVRRELAVVPESREIVICGVEGDDPAGLPRSLLDECVRRKVFAVDAGRRGVQLWELHPVQTDLGYLSPEELVGAILAVSEPGTRPD